MIFCLISIGKDIIVYNTFFDNNFISDRHIIALSSNMNQLMNEYINTLIKSLNLGCCRHLHFLASTFDFVNTVYGYKWMWLNCRQVIVCPCSISTSRSLKELLSKQRILFLEDGLKSTFAVVLQKHFCASDCAMNKRQEQIYNLFIETYCQCYCKLIIIPC